jgi:NAD(P)-dependent dehydrogenase (short-subunit alcohol dehydrogenase family)
LSGRLVILAGCGPERSRGDDDRSRALTLALAAEGASVVVVAPDAHAGGRLAAELRAREGGRVAVFCPGPDTAADVDALVELAAELGPRP